MNTESWWILMFGEFRCSMFYFRGFHPCTSGHCRVLGEPWVKAQMPQGIDPARLDNGKSLMDHWKHMSETPKKSGSWLHNNIETNKSWMVTCSCMVCFAAFPRETRRVQKPQRAVPKTTHLSGTQGISDCHVWSEVANLVQWNVSNCINVSDL